MSFPNTAEPFTLQRMSGQPRKRRWLTIGLPLLAVLLLAGVGVTIWRVTAKPGLDPKVAACRDAVTLNLAAPATAKFSQEKVGETSDADGGRYPTVDGVVDSQNLAGALVRNRFHCTFNQDDTIRNGNVTSWP